MSGASAGVSAITEGVSKLSVDEKDLSKLTQADLQSWWTEHKSTLVDCDKRKAKDIGYFSHCTSEEYMKKIKDSKSLKGFPPAFGPLKDKGINGVYFTASLFRGDLPNKSPYGPKRVLVPIDSIVTDMSEWSMYFELSYKMNRGNKFVRFVLVKNSNANAKRICDEKLVRVELKDNPLLFWKEDQSSLAGKVTGHEIYQAGLPPQGLFTILFVVGDVSTAPDGVKWDNVEHNRADGGKPELDGMGKNYKFLWS